MNEFLLNCLIVCPLVFLAGFVDSIAGGGGLISLPAYFLIGLPAHTAAGTNKVVSSIGTTVSTIDYIKSGKTNLRYGIISAAAALIGSSISTSFAVYLSDNILKIIILCALPTVAIALALKKDFGSDTSRPVRQLSPSKENVLCACIGFVMGAYDGLVGPGTGTFLIMLFTLILGTDLLTSSGCAKISNLASNLASAAVWIFNGHVIYALVIPAALCNMLGHHLGAKFAIKGGSKKVRGMIFVVLGLLFAKMLYELLA